VTNPIAGRTTVTATLLAAGVDGSTDEADGTLSQLAIVANGHGGHVARTSIDGMVAAFEAAAPALAAAVDMHAATPPSHGLRIGVAAGDVRWDDAAVAGAPVAIAASLRAAASAGQILIDEVVHLLARDQRGERYELIGPVELEGGSGSTKAYGLQWAPPATIDATEPPRPLLPPSLRAPAAHALVGRDDELASLEHSWQLARSAGQIVLIGGEAGSGKTRLAAEFARMEHGAGAAVFLGRCDDDLAVPYQPWVQVVEQLTDGRLEPELVVQSLDPESARYRLYEAFADALREAVTRWPTVVVLEDLHWAGVQTLALLRHLARTGLPAGLLIVGTFRDTSDELTEPLAACLADLRRVDVVNRLRLEGLDGDAIERFVTEAIGHDLDAGFKELAAELMSRSAGNAFYIVELWRHLVASGAVTASAGRWVIQEAATTSIVPDSVREVVGARLAKLSPASQTMIEMAAVAGQRVDLDVLAVALDVSADELDAPLDELVSAGLLASEARTGLVFEFEHALVRDTVEVTVSHVGRKRAHLAVAEAIEMVHVADHRPVLAELARHFAAAVPLAPVDKAVEYGRQAAAQAVRSAAYDEAASHLGAVLALGAPDLQRAEALIELATVRLRVGLHGPSREHSREAFILASRVGAADVAAEAALQFELGTHMPGLPGGPAVELLSRALDVMDDRMTPLRVRLQASLGRALAIGGKTDLANEVIDVALAQARQIGDTQALLVGLEAVITAADDPTRILDAAGELEAIARRGDDVWGIAYGSANRCRAQTALGDLSDASLALERFRGATAAGRFPAFQLMTTHLETILAIAAGDLAGAEALAEQGLTQDAVDESGASAGVYGVQMFTIRRAQGRLAEVTSVLELLAASADPPPVWRPGLAALYAELGMLDDAKAHFEALSAEAFAAVARDSMWPACLMFLAETCLALGDTDHADVLAAELLPFHGRNLMAAFTICFGPADRLLGGLAELSGRTVVADRHFQAALELAERSGSPVWTAEVLFDWAAALSARGDAKRAAPLDRRADELAARIGMGRRRRVGRSATTCARPPLPSGLSEREAEVLRCVGEGLSNREIGARLFISENTVANHIRTILRKTGCANRTEATTYAHRTGVIAG
jgi:DNA-binding CsgD family transcriptional regulator/tetratricopeptide (TPR) repeat protein